MTTYHELTGFQRDLLTAIAGVADEPYGLALKDYLDEHYPKPINHSRLYQNLDELVEAGLVSRESLDERTNAYRLTDAGESCLQAQAETLASVCDTRQVVADGGDRQ
ncbi:PadR family transcriptional regulator [Halomicroarcula sp. GCM10025709]|uniref:PadR family transcriptional regulator n=1 Tax=Haloarcula TaxID=2237 RepID=UPI0024C3C77F|nr:helix-turn-helix transcriptional regulator [Halomicroarcula sp. YJ-61-S]